jgi:hypothetical protein
MPGRLDVFSRLSVNLNVFALRVVQRTNHSGWIRRLTAGVREIPMKLKLFSTVLFALLVSLPARGAKICETDMETLLRVHASRDFSPFTGHDQEYRLDEEYVVTRGGTAAVFRTTGQLPSPAHGRTVAFGRAKPAAFTALLNALADNQVDTQTSCFQVNNVQVFPVLIFGTYDVSWFGSDGRENSFQIVFGRAGDSSFPACGPEAIALDRAIRVFADSLAANSATRVCP